jgi:hypothetical protein
MDTTRFLTAQNMMTLLIVLAIAVWLYLRVRRSQKRRGEEPGELPPGPTRRPPDTSRRAPP